MMGGAWYEKIANFDSDSLVQLAFEEIRKHLKLKIEPRYHELNILKVFFQNFKMFAIYFFRFLIFN
jgi:hypothetical protein